MIKDKSLRDIGWNRQSKSLCWDCVNSTDKNKCSWVNNFTISEGMSFDANGDLIECKEFIKESFNNKSFCINEKYSGDIIKVVDFRRDMRISKAKFRKWIEEGIPVIKDKYDKVIGLDMSKCMSWMIKNNK